MYRLIRPDEAEGKRITSVIPVQEHVIAFEIEGNQMFILSSINALGTMKIIPITRASSSSPWYRILTKMGYPIERED
ncbi:MAG: hypothetical protein QXZ09_08955 [Candidatus Methanomethylicaceae archaeon]